MLEPKNNAQLPAIPGKRYFTIGEVSELCGVKPHVLRYWEQEFPQLKPVKRRGNRRYYQRQDVIIIRQIRSLLYEQGFTIGGARNKLGGEEARGVRPLAGQQAIDVAVKRRALLGLAFLQITFGASARERFTQWARLFIGSRRPVQAILFSLSADELAGVVLQRVFFHIEHVVLALCIDECQARLDGGKLVFPDAAVDEFLGAGRAVEMPAAAAFHDGEGERPFVRANFQRDRFRDSLVEGMRLVI